MPLEESCTHPLCDALAPFAHGGTNVDGATTRGLNELKAALMKHDFSSTNVARVLGPKHALGLDARQAAVCGNARCQPLASPNQAAELDIIIQLFLRINLEVDALPPQGVPRKAAERAIGSRAINVLIKLQVLHETQNGSGPDTHLHSLVQLLPYDKTLFIATDFFQVANQFWTRKLEPVMALGLDSDALAFGAPRHHHSKRLLDLCTGSGVQGIIAASYYAEDVTLVDVSPRAARFARFNLLLNGVSSERGRVFVGSLYEALPAGTAPFDTILANPPYLPDAEQTNFHLYGAGGPYGHRITSAVISGAGRWLVNGPSGEAFVRIVATVYNLDQYAEWLTTWWRQGSSAAAEVTLFTGRIWTRESMLANGLAGGGQKDIDSGGNALLWIRRRPTTESTAVPGNVLFYRSQLHPFLWHILRKDTALRDMIQYLLRSKPAALLPSYADLTDEVSPGHERFKEVWIDCAASMQMSWVGVVNVMLRQLPWMQQDQLFACVHEGLLVKVGELTGANVVFNPQAIERRDEF